MVRVFVLQDEKVLEICHTITWIHWTVHQDMVKMIHFT
jgi:hypothetical protein